ncbi:uncharacterized protein V6R79_014773 [Siganus canaliculatus]
MMMKYMLVLVGLLHLCSNVMSNTSCYRGIITDLSKLNKLYKEKQVTINSKQMLVPSEEMHKNACSCLGVFAQKVKQVLSNNVTANNKSRHIIHQIKASLGDLEKHPAKVSQQKHHCLVDASAVAFIG